MAVELLQTGAVERTVRLDPRTKLVLLVSVSTALLVGGSGPVMDAARVLMLLAPFALLAVSAVALMSPKPATDSMLMSSMPPATTNEALPAAILSTASSTETAAVAQAPTGLIIEP